MTHYFSGIGSFYAAYRGAAQKKYHKQHYTKLSAALPGELAAEFSEACRALGVSRPSVLTPIILDIIEKAKMKL
jgi:hypothetical protein